MLFKLTVAVVVAAVALVIALLLRGGVGLLPKKGGKTLELVIKILVGIIIVWLLLLGNERPGCCGSQHELDHSGLVSHQHQHSHRRLDRFQRSGLG